LEHCTKVPTSFSFSIVVECSDLIGFSRTFLQGSQFTPTMTTLRAPRPIDGSIMYVEETSPEERTTHAASCHCGAVQYDVTLKYPFPKYPVNKCTCSICFNNGYLLVYPCRRDVVFTKGTSQPHTSRNINADLLNRI
jgi:hypothetical protein